MKNKFSLYSLFNSKTNSTFAPQLDNWFILPAVMLAWTLLFITVVMTAMLFKSYRQ